jgi:class 3 adenylate cyclase
VLESTRDFARYIEMLARRAAPNLQPEARRSVENILKASASPSGMRQLLGHLRDLDLRDLLPRIRVPTLVVHATDDALIPVSHGRYFAEHIPGARLVEVASDYHLFFADSATTAIALTAIEEFLTGNVVHSADRTMATILFTDIVDSTSTQQRMGDEAWRTLRKSFEAGSTRLVEQYGGRVVQFTGDGVMASFSSASQALRAGRALREDARGLGVAIRSGVHAGEAYTVEDQLFGTCVTVAARVAAQAGAGELFTTETVQDLVAGSGFSFRDAGTYELKGLGSRRLLAVDS